MTDQDLPIIYTLQKKLATLSSEFDAFRLYAWLQYDHTQIAYWRNQFALRFQLQDIPCYLAPPETEDFPALLAELAAYEKSMGGKVFQCLCVEQPPKEIPTGFQCAPRRELFDYLYAAEDLISMPGRAYAAKRNQIAQFKRKYVWRFEPLAEKNQSACHTVVEAWAAAHNSTTLAAEQTAIQRMLALREPYGQSGGVLFADDQPVAFAIGTHPRDALLDIIAEKALPGYIGAYSTIIQTYAAYAYSLAPYRFINREEDMGLENLRSAKLQLKPVRLIEKFLLTAPL